MNSPSSTYQEYIELLERATSVAQAAILKCCKKTAIPPKVLTPEAAKAGEILSKALVKYLPISNIQSSCNQNEAEQAASFVSIGVSDVTNPCEAALPHTVKYKNIILERIQAILASRAEVTGRDIIFLYFCIYAFNLSIDEDSRDINVQQVFKDEVTNALSNLGLEKDVTDSELTELILISLLSKNPFTNLENILKAVF